ncbi:MAG: hypothetical protein KC983_12070 [Phycisphaerales bacterium]|nr:hypothetical protein [Phycisphaerales bacterium]
MRRIGRTWRWWNWVGLALALSFIIDLGVTLVTRLIEAFAVLVGSAADLPVRSDLPLILLGVHTLITMVWLHFVIPWKGAATVQFTDRRTPRLMLRAYMMSLWMPAAILIVVLVTNFAPVYFGRFTVAQWIRLQPWLTWAAWLPLGLAVPALMLGPTVRRRVLTAAQHAERCVQCGYHYAGVTSINCPECGRPLPVV